MNLDKVTQLWSEKLDLVLITPQSMAMMQYGPEWRACRKLEHMVLSPTSVRQYHPLQEKFAAMLAKEISEDPENFYDRVRL